MHHALCYRWSRYPSSAISLVTGTQWGWPHRDRRQLHRVVKTSRSRKKQHLNSIGITTQSKYNLIQSPLPRHHDVFPLRFVYPAPSNLTITPRNFKTLLNFVVSSELDQVLPSLESKTIDDLPSPIHVVLVAVIFSCSDCFLGATTMFAVEAVLTAVNVIFLILVLILIVFVLALVLTSCHPR